MIWIAILVFICFSKDSVSQDHGFDFKKLGPNPKAEDSENAVKDLIIRLIGNQSVFFDVSVVPNLGNEDKDLFKVHKRDGDESVKITGSSGVAAAWGFHYYLKNYCKCHVSWDGNQISIPPVLPNVNDTILANDRFRYYQNVCTTSYSFVWWTWKRWEREIDWMALNGFNLVLAFNGQEEIWRRVYLKMGLTKEEIGLHFSGPAFLSWNRMGNMRGWGGPLTQSWHNRSMELQKRILKRMRDIGITPVLPAFAGHVPRAFSRIFPNASLTILPKWNSFPDEYCCPYLLSPEDDHFKIIGSQFLKEYINEFGTDHIYNCDTFNEMLPSSGDTGYLRTIGKEIYQSMANVDPHAIWLLQGWLFKHDFLFWTKKHAEALLTSVEIGKLLVLDLQAELTPQYERLDSFFGQPFIWCMLHNFGGTLGLHGSVEKINYNIFVARKFQNSTMVGTGITPEGINQNYVMYDLLMDMFWRKEPANLPDWFREYTVRRYGQVNEFAISAWQILKESVYNYTGTLSQHGQYILVKHPQLNLKASTWYHQSTIFDAWKNMLLAADEMDYITETFCVDLVDITRQALQLKIDVFFELIRDSFLEKNISKFQLYAELFLTVLDDLETILASNSKFLLGKWIKNAKAQATTPLEEKMYEKNARNQITIWGPNGEIKDYANKQWSGLVRDYYKPRWKIFFSELNTSLINATPFKQKEVSRIIYEMVEQPFTYSNVIYLDKPKGNSIVISNFIFRRWGQYEDLTMIEDSSRIF